MNSRSIKKIFIIVPSGSLASPIKGAVALANALCREKSVCFVSLKKQSEAFSMLDVSVEQVSLGALGSWPARLIELRKLLRLSGTKKSIASISFCFSADVINSLCCDLAVICSSVRGNLPIVYSETYGKIGGFIAYWHLRRLSKFDYVTSMNRVMADQVKQIIHKPSPVICNFLDENRLEPFRQKNPQLNGPLRFIFTGSMIYGKQPMLVLNAIGILQQRGVEVILDMYGDGPLLPQLREKAKGLLKPEFINFYGYVDEPYSAISKSDALVLPSLTEGISRSALESLYLGVPCVLRDVDGNSELVKFGKNGGLFKNESDLADVMMKVATWSRKVNPLHKCLLPSSYRQNSAAMLLLKVLEGKII